MSQDIKEELKVNGEELLKKIKDLVHQGNIRRIIIRNEQGETYLEIPLNVGIAGLVLAPVFAAVGALAALASKFQIVIVKRDDAAPDKSGASE